MTEKYNWKNYVQKYISFVMGISNTRLTCTVASRVLKDLPAHFPDEVIAEFENASEQLKKQVRRLFEPEKTKYPAKVTVGHDSETAQTGSELLIPRLLSKAAEEKLGTSEQANSVPDMLHSQQLIMLFAYIEAFFGDTLRSICKINPDVLKRKKQIEWETALSFNDIGELRNHITDLFVFEFNQPSVISKIENLNSYFKLKIDISDSTKKILGDCECLRNVLIHDGGTVGVEYIKRTRKEDVNIGDKLKVTPYQTHQLYFEMLRIGLELFKAVSLKFFRVEEREIKDVTGFYEIFGRGYEE